MVPLYVLRMQLTQAYLTLSYLISSVLSVLVRSGASPDLFYTHVSMSNTRRKGAHQTVKLL